MRGFPELFCTLRVVADVDALAVGTPRGGGRVRAVGALAVRQAKHLNGAPVEEVAGGLDADLRVLLRQPLGHLGEEAVGKVLLLLLLLLVSLMETEYRGVHAIERPLPRLNGRRRRQNGGGLRVPSGDDGRREVEPGIQGRLLLLLLLL